MKSVKGRYRRLWAELHDPELPGDRVMEIVDELRRLAEEMRTLPGPTSISLIPACTVEKWFADEAQAGECCSPPPTAIHSIVECVHNLQHYWSPRWLESAMAPLAELRVQVLLEDTAVAQRASDDLIRVLPAMVEFAEFLDEASPNSGISDPRLDAVVRELAREDAKKRGHNHFKTARGLSDRALLSLYLSTAQEMQRRWGSPRRPGEHEAAFWTITARFLAIPIGEAWAQAGVRTGYETADGPLLAVLAKAVCAITGMKHLSTSTLASALRRHPPLKGWNLQKQGSIVKRDSGGSTH